MIEDKTSKLINETNFKESFTDIMNFSNQIRGKANNEIDLNGQFIEVRILDHSGGIVKRVFLPVASNLEQRLIEIVKKSIVDKCHVYVGIAFRDNETSGKDSDCSMITFLITDHDEINGSKIKDITDSSVKVKARQKILDLLQNETNYPPTMIVDSGNGYHAYYFLNSFVDARKFQETIKAKSKWLAERYPHCPGDPAMLRISQHIRLPGSLNVKNLDDIRPCRIVEYHPGICYSFSEIPEAVIKVVPSRSSTNQVNFSKTGLMYPFGNYT